MLSTSVIKNVSGAGHYFAAKDNYYTRDEGDRQSEWFGCGAQQLGLDGMVDSGQFTQLLNGRLPNGEQIGKMVDGVVTHRPGWDLTFSAPKSVSVLALIGGDRRLIEAHRQAVFTALSEIERGCSEARIRSAGAQSFQRTGNITAALYHHDLSRARDPQLHTHSVVMNLTQRTDGQWRSMASKMGRYDGDIQDGVHGFIERVRNNKRYFGKLYEAELAFRVRELGYDIVVDREKGSFEIGGVSPEVIRHFSKRRVQIEKAMQESGFTGEKAAQIAGLNTRENKKDVDRSVLTSEWKSSAQSLGLICNNLIQQSIAKSKEQSGGEKQNSSDTVCATPTLNPTAVLAVQQAAHHLSRFKTVFTLEALVTSALEHVTGDPLRPDVILEAIKSSNKAGDLIRSDNDSGRTVFMAKETLSDETRLYAHLGGQANNEKIPETTLKTLAERHATCPETAAQLHEFFGKDRIILVEGQFLHENLIEPAIKTARDAGLEVAVISASPSSSRDFARSIKPHSFRHRVRTLLFGHDINHYSVMQFLSAKERSEPDVLLVDNANLLSTWQMAELAEWSAKQDGRLILMGDKNTLLSQQTGFSLQELSVRGVKTITIDPTDRADSKKNRLHMAEVMDPDERYRAMAAHYGRLPDRERSRAFLTAHQKKSVDTLNCLAHSEVKERSNGRVLQADLLIPIFIPESMQGNASAYPAGHRVRFNEDMPSLAIRRGDYLKVDSSDRALNRVVLQKNNGRTVFWNPGKEIENGRHRSVELFAEKSRELVMGERIVFSHSIASRNLLKGDRMTISGLQRNGITLKSDDGRTVTLDLNRTAHRHFDYGYAGTLHSLAHDKPSVLISEFPVRSFATTQRHYRQAVTQPDQTWIYTDNIQSFCKTVEKNTGDRLSAHETLKQAAENAKSLRTLTEVIRKYLPESPKPGSDNFMDAVSAVEYALHHLAEREAGFSHRQIIEMAVSKAMGSVRPETLTQVITAAENAGVLIRGRNSDGTLWTTLDAIRMEREIVSLCRSESKKGQFIPLADDAVISRHSASASLKPEQTEAVRMILQSQDRVIAIQGYPGTGKTTMLETVSDILKSTDSILLESPTGSRPYELLGLAPTNRAVAELKKRGLPAQTLDSFLNTIRHESSVGDVSDRKHLILVVDESSMVSNRKARDFLQTVHNLDCRAVMVGDIRQLSAVESGKPFALIQSCVNTCRLIDIRRQKDPILIQAVDQVIKKDFQSTFATLKQSIIEVNENTHALIARDSEGMRAEARSVRIDLLAKDYLSYPENERSQVQIITPGHDDRMLVNQRIRELMKDQGCLGMHGDRPCPILRPVSLTQMERSDSNVFRPGQMLRFAVTQSGGIRAGEYLTVQEVNAADRMLTLQKADGSTSVWQIPDFSPKRRSDIEVFQTETRGLQSGDMIRWTRSDRENGLFATEGAHIISVTGDRITAKLGNGEPFTFNASDRRFQHWDHGYAATVYAVQGDTKPIVLAHMESWRGNLSTQPAFLVALTRSVNQFRLYTDDAGRLLEAIMAKSGVKLSSLQVAGEYPVRDKPSHTVSMLSDIQHQLPSSTKKSAGTPSLDREAVRRINDCLNENSAEIATNLLGEPRVKGGNFMKFGRHQGSLCVTTRGEKQGWWHDFSEQQGGRSMLSFLQKQGGMTRQEAIEYGAKLAGIAYTNPTRNLGNHSPRLMTVMPAETNINEADSGKSAHKRVAYARKLAAESVPVHGTLAEKYLKTHRGIGLKEWPDSVRFHPGIYSGLNKKTLPAMITVATNARGDIQAIQATWLDPNTAAKINKTEVIAQKQTFGILKGAYVHLGNNHAKTTLIAEGTETGLSLLKAIPEASVRVTLGKSNLSHIDPKSLPEKAVLCLDNDGKRPDKDPAIVRAVQNLNHPNISLRVMIPDNENGKKRDYNDVLIQLGESVIRNEFAQAHTPENLHFSLNTPNKSRDHSHLIMERGIRQVSNELVKNPHEQAIKKSGQISAWQENQRTSLTHEGRQGPQFEHEI